MLFLCVNVYCHRVTTQLQLINIIIINCLSVGVYIYIYFDHPFIDVSCGSQLGRNKLR